jgi:hypothetical protein
MYILDLKMYFSEMINLLNKLLFGKHALFDCKLQLKLVSKIRKRGT